ncbi:MAG: efflux RND transporter periplasmic adaptor subunit [Candidatus Falkowbacteria bacterium]|nr:MAG: efflux RND transporter periplasmic adaptor subunit [Candidatus Falkowbacteria bacterium]
MAQSILEESKKAKRGFFGFIFSKKFLIIGIIVLAAAGAGYYFYNRNTKTQTAVVQQKKYTVNKEDLKISVSASGKVVAKDGVELSFPVSGNLEVDNVYVKEGDKIKKGDKIASVKTETLEFELRSAYNNYQSALATYNSKIEPATASEIAKSKAAIEQAQVSLDQAKISLEQTKVNQAQNIANAENTLETAQDNLKLNTDASDSEIVRSAYSDLAINIKSINITLQKILRDSDSVIGVDEQSINDDFENVLGAKDSSSLSGAKDSYARAKSLRNDIDSRIVALTTSNSSEIDAVAIKMESVLSAFQDHLYNMQKMLDATITFTGLSQSKLDGFKSTVSSNRSSINSAISSLDNSVQAVVDAKLSLKKFQIAYDKAKQDLEITKNQATQNIKNSENSVKSREISLTQAKQDYQDLIAPISSSDLASARAQLTSASISVDKAKYNYEQATLTSPIDGVVSMLNYKKGDIILSDSAKTMATIINNDTLYIEADIEEADISKLKVGDKAQVTFDAVDGVKLTGEVSFIAMTSDTSANGIVTYLVRVLLTNTGENQVREGMTAAIEFVTSEAADVLAVPVAAVRNVGGNPSVEKIDGSFATVVTGFTDGKKVEIISGLNAGELIVY